MAEITIPADDPVEIVPEGYDGPGHNITHVSGDDVHLHHKRQDVGGNPQEVIRPYDRVRMGDYRNTGVYAFSPDGATIRVNERGFSLDFLAREVNVSPGQRASRTNLSGIQATGPVTVSTGQSITEIYENTDGERDFIPMGYAWFEEGYTDDISLRFQVFNKDGGGNILDLAAGPIGTTPLPFEPHAIVRDGDGVEVVAENDSGAPVDMRFAVSFYEV